MLAIANINDNVFQIPDGFGNASQREAAAITVSTALIQDATQLVTADAALANLLSDIHAPLQALFDKMRAFPRVDRKRDDSRVVTAISVGPSESFYAHGHRSSPFVDDLVGGYIDSVWPGADTK